VTNRTALMTTGEGGRLSAVLRGAVGAPHGALVSLARHLFPPWHINAPNRRTYRSDTPTAPP